MTVTCQLEAEEVRHASQIADSACPFCIGVNAKKGTLSQHFMTRVIPPLSWKMTGWTCITVASFTRS